jgi:hypothetical protein
MDDVISPRRINRFCRGNGKSTIPNLAQTTQNRSHSMTSGRSNGRTRRLLNNSIALLHGISAMSRYNAGLKVCLLKFSCVGTAVPGDLTARHLKLRVGDCTAKELPLSEQACDQSQMNMPISLCTESTQPPLLSPPLPFNRLLLSK